MTMYGQHRNSSGNRIRCSSLKIVLLVSIGLLTPFSNAFAVQNLGRAALSKRSKIPVTDPHFPSAKTFGVENRPSSGSGSTISTSSTSLYATPPPMSIDMPSLATYFLETVISYGVPAVFTSIVLLIAAKVFRGPRSERDMTDLINNGLFQNTVSELYEDLYDGDSKKNGLPFLSMFSDGPQGGKKDPNAPPKNLGVPAQEYLTVTNINSKYSSYEYSLTKAIDSKSKAASDLRVKSFQRALNKAVSGSDSQSVTGPQRLALLVAEKEFLKEGAQLMQDMVQLQRTVTDLSVQEEMDDMDVEIGQIEIPDAVIIDANTTSNTTAKADSNKPTKSPQKRKSQIKSTLADIQSITTSILELELSFLRTVISTMGPSRANGIRAALLGNIDGGGGEALPGGLLKTLTQRPLVKVLDTLGYTDVPDERAATEQMDTAEPVRNVFVTDFPGDVTASQVGFLREEVTAIVRAAKPGDEALLVLQSGGGTVTGYGLAAAQLKRFKDAGMRLTICVEQVAASGGYMMCCVADKIVASPFAVLGSIGVIGEVPNAYERLKKEGIEFQTVTAGKYKRTLTPTKKITQEDIDKQKEDLEGILRLFKAFVKNNRPSLDIDDVATGETWFGQDAMDKGLCDEIKTVDDVLVAYVDVGHNVYDVKFKPPNDKPLGALAGLLPGGVRQTVGGADSGNGRGGGVSGGVIRSLTRLLLENVVPVVRDEIVAELEAGVEGSLGVGMNGDDVRNRYMVRDPSDAAGNIRID